MTKEIFKIMFVCHGNICRSPMAEYIFKYLSNNNYIVESRATSTEEIGNDIYYLAKKELDMHNIPYSKHKALQITLEEYNEYDLIVCFDEKNINNLNRLFVNNKKVIKLLDKDIDDPWYTGDFKKTYFEIYEGCVELLKKLKKSYY